MSGDIIKTKAKVLAISNLQKMSSSMMGLLIALKMGQTFKFAEDLLYRYQLHHLPYRRYGTKFGK
jgi:uncharacterized protein YjgD (DUF1641 family)